MAVNLHPDANQMSALLGGELQGTARRAVIAHLSQCAECRQWTGLAQSAREAVMPAATPARSHQPWIFYALPAAAALALAGALWLRPALIVTAPAPPHATTVPVHHSPASRLPPAPPPALTPEPAQYVPPAVEDVLVVPTPAPRSAVASLASLAALPAPSAPSGEFQPAIDFSPLMTGFQDQTAETSAEVQFANQFLPLNSSSSAMPGPTATAASSNPDLAVLATPAAQGFVPVLQRARPLSGPYAPRSTPAPDGALGWTVSRGGALLHSIGTGIWAAVPLVPGVHFRAIFASGAHIWAGADADQLFASTDRGAHWRHLALPESTPHATHIDSIAFSNAHRGVVRLDNGHVWITADGGTTWTASH
ncbi:MAG TPA: zf-HC2 domain-containing protein [Terriglobales bacterium]|nr:zf-HC2 domain-containing protein [Terriglobales bacterium]